MRMQFEPSGEPIFTGASSRVPREVDFEQLLRKFVADTVTVRRQAPVSTPWGTFVLDFIVEVDGKRIAVECDGTMERVSRYAGDTWGDLDRRYPARRVAGYDVLKDSAWLEEWRDALVLGTGAVTDVVRFALEDIEDAQEDCLYFLTRLFPFVFSPRARHILERLATPDAKTWDDLTSEWLHLHRLRRDDDGAVNAEHSFNVWWRRRDDRCRNIWEGMYKSALQIGACPFNELVVRERDDWNARLDQKTDAIT